MVRATSEEPSEERSFKDCDLPCQARRRHREYEKAKSIENEWSFIIKRKTVRRTSGIKFPLYTLERSKSSAPMFIDNKGRKYLQESLYAFNRFAPCGVVDVDGAQVFAGRTRNKLYSWLVDRKRFLVLCSSLLNIDSD